MYRTRILAVSMALLLGAGCNAVPRSTVSDVSAKPVITDEMLNNLTYPLTYDPGTGSESVTLKDGSQKFADKRGEYAGEAHVQPASIAHGDLNGDGYEDAIVQIGVNTGGTGTFPSVYLVMNENGRAVPYPTPVPELGDREWVNRTTIVGDQVTFSLLVHAVDEPLCCPSVHKEESYRFKDNKLIPLK